jgi:hypothetical protein
MKEKHYQIGKWYMVNGEERQLTGFVKCENTHCKKRIDYEHCENKLLLDGVKEAEPLSNWCGWGGTKRPFPLAENQHTEKYNYWKVGSVYVYDHGIEIKCVDIIPCEYREKDTGNGYGVREYCKECPGRPVWYNWYGLVSQDYCPAALLFSSTPTWKEVGKPEGEPQYEDYQVGNTYLVKWKERVCTGFAKCNWVRNDGGYQKCQTCPGTPIWDNNSESSCGHNNGKLIYKLVKKAPDKPETMEERVARIKNHIEQEVAKWERKS